LPLHAEEKPLSKKLFHIDIRKAGLTACLFCFCSFAHSQSLTPASDKAYALALNLQWQKARPLLTGNDANSIYVAGLCNAMELLINEDKKLFEVYETFFEESLSELEEAGERTPEILFAQAELNLQWAFIYLKFEHELDAAFRLRKAHQLAVKCRAKYPDFLSILKTHGVLQIMLGSVPEKYSWLLGIMNMEGSIETGISELQRLAGADDNFSFEADLTLALIHGYVLQDMQQSSAITDRILKNQPDNQLSLFAGASLALKNSEGKKALMMLEKLDEAKIPSVQYFKGEALLCKGDYTNSAKAFQNYITTFKGESFIKDAYFKMGICYSLLDQKNKAEHYYSLAKQNGQTNTEADKYAARTLADTEELNTKLLKIRFFTDGGYYAEVREEIAQIVPLDLRTEKHKVEFYYRQARLAHKTNQLNAAKLFYQQVIDMNGDNPWYFAPNACLQTGYIWLGQNNSEEAKKYFQKALTYKKHEYKNSIDAKAKSALAQLKERK